MGTFTHYYGPKQLIPEKKQEFVERALKILQYGGAMGVEPIPLSGEWAYLLKPVVQEGYGYIFAYSYFEHSLWEDIALVPEDGRLATGKVGYSIFGQTCFAVNLQREFYSVVPGVAALHGTDPVVEGCIGWLNFLFHEDWDNRRTFRIQRLYRDLPDWRDKYCGCEANPDAKEFLACLAKPVETSGEIDPKLLKQMAADGVGSGSDEIEVWSFTTLEFLNLASCIDRYFRHAGDITDDDRAFWWKPGGEIRFSKDMEHGLQAIHGYHSRFLQDGQEIAVRPALMSVLEETAKKYHRPFLFSSFFWEFIDRQQDRNVQAAEGFHEESMADGPILCCVGQYGIAERSARLLRREAYSHGAE